MGSTRLDSQAGWEGRPLCCRYVLVHFAAQPIQARTGSAARGWTVTWALGAMRDEQPEAVGVWKHPIDGVLDWRSVFDDLAARGVERIRYAANLDAAAAQTTFPDLTVLSTAGSEPGELDVAAGQADQMSTGMRRAGGGRHCDANGLPRRGQQLARRVDQAAQLLQRGLSQAATRHGPFESGLVAAAFVEAWLANAELRQRRRRLAAIRAADLRVAAAAP
jgi:hypothetical protein